MGLLALPFALARAPLTVLRAAEAVRRLPADEVMARLDELNANLERLARAEESLGTLAETAAVLHELAAARPALDALAETATPLARLAEASSSLETLARNASVLPAIAANSRSLPKLPDRMLGLEHTMDRLEASVRVLAEATAPLQSTTARLGRLVDRIPERRRRDEEQ